MLNPERFHSAEPVCKNFDKSLQNKIVPAVNCSKMSSLGEKKKNNCKDSLLFHHLLILPHWVSYPIFKQFHLKMTKQSFEINMEYIILCIRRVCLLISIRSKKLLVRRLSPLFSNQFLCFYYVIFIFPFLKWGTSFLESLTL